MANWINKKPKMQWPSLQPDAPLISEAQKSLVEWKLPKVNLASSTVSKTVSKPTSKPSATPAWAQTLTPQLPKPTADIATDITVPKSPAIKALETGIATTEQAIEDAPIEAQDRIIEEQFARSAEIAQAKEFAEERTDIIETQDEAIAETEAQIQTLSQERAVRDAEALTTIKDAELEKAGLIVEEQRLKNQIAEKEAEQKIDVAKQQATWAFNKLWLGFSSGIILEVQRIATRWANELALIKVTGAKFLADTKVAVAKLEQWYASEINRTIDKYTDISIASEQNSIKRIANTQNNLLLNSQQKQKQIDSITSDFKSETRKIEDDMRAEQERMADKLIKQTFTLQGELTAQQNQEKTVINNQFNSGAWFNLTESQKWIQLTKAGLGLEEGKAMENTLFSKTITKEVASVVWNNVTLTWNDRKSIQNLATSYMEWGLVFAEANKRATLDYIANVPRLAQVKKIQDAKLKAALAPKSVTTATAPLLSNEDRDAFLAAWGSLTQLDELEEFGWVEAAIKWLELKKSSSWEIVLADWTIIR